MPDLNKLSKKTVQREADDSQVQKIEPIFIASITISVLLEIIFFIKRYYDMEKLYSKIDNIRKFPERRVSEEDPKDKTNVTDADLYKFHSFFQDSRDKAVIDESYNYLFEMTKNDWMPSLIFACM